VATTWKFVKEFVGFCDVCACAKNPYHRLHGFFQPLPVLVSPWSSIPMDFIVDLPQSNSFDSILVVVDCVTRMAHFIPCNKSLTGEKTIKLFLDHVFRYHGFSKDIIFNRAPQFASKF
jgi:hypothetical protein